MRAKASSLFLVNSASGKMVKGPTFRTDEVIPQSGIYRVRHQKHRLPHEVTLLRGQQFPRCSKCRNAVTFYLVWAVGTEVTTEFSTRIYLYELPVIEDKEEIAV
jgi:hypothetical protein